MLDSNLMKTMCAVGAASLMLGVCNAQPLTLHENLEIRPTEDETTTLEPQEPKEGTPPYYEENTSYTFTDLDAGEIRRETTSGGVEATTGGDLSLSSAEIDGFKYEYDRVTTFEVDPETGDKIDGTKENWAVHAERDEDGNVETITKLQDLDDEEGELDYDSLSEDEKKMITDNDPEEIEERETGGNLFTEGGVKNADGSNLIRRDEEDGSVHIGENSLVTNEVDGVQELHAEDGAGNPIAIDVTESDLQVEGESVSESMNQTDTNTDEITRVEGESIDRDNTLQGNINQEVEDRSALIRRDEEDGMVHIGNDSIVTGVQNGEQVLRAQDQQGEDIDLRINGDTNLNVDNNVNVDGTTTTSDLNVENNANVQGTTTTNNLGVANNAEVGNDLVVSNNAMIGQDATVAGTTTTSDLNVENNANVQGTTSTGDLNVSRNASVGQDMQVGRDAAVGRSLHVADDVYVGGRSQGLQSQVDSNRSAIKDNADDIDTNRRGIAMVAAMTNTKIEEGKKQALDSNLTYYEDELGLGLGYGYRINDTMQLNFAGASTTDFEEGVGRVGISMQW